MSLRVQTALPRPRDVLGEFGLYVHVPFCTRRCWYCDFNAYAGLDDLVEPYMTALVRDVATAASAPAGGDLEERPRVTSVFIGGGTPSLVDAHWISALMDAVRSSWDLAGGAEVTIECNPESVRRSKLEAYLRAGVNRVSIGVQSLDDGLLARLGRVHDASAALRALDAARQAGFEEVNADLIFGIPGEDDVAWRDTLARVLDRGPAHVSCYALTYEEGTPLHSWRRIGRVVPEADDDVARRWHIADDLLSRAGLPRYETSNWARPSSRSRHNSLYWRCGEYLGLGAGAHSHVASAQGALRSWTVRAPARYVQAIRTGLSPVAGAERIDQRTRATEVMVLGLRRTEGVSAVAFERLVGRQMDDVFGPKIRTAAERRLVSWDGRRLRLRDPLLGDAAAVMFA